MAQFNEVKVTTNCGYCGASMVSGSTCPCWPIHSGLAMQAKDAELAAARAEIERLEEELSGCRASHGKLACGIKDALGLEHWPDIGKELFTDAAIRLLKAEVDRLRAAIRPAKPMMH